MTIAPPKFVSPFEDKLLKVAQALVGGLPVEQGLPHIQERSLRPATLSRAAVELVGDTLIKGSVLFLARAGGWRRERFLRDGKPRDGRLWDRTAPADMPLLFSRHALDWLLWLTSGRPDDSTPAPNPPEAELTPADLLLFFLSYNVLRDTQFSAPLRSRPMIATHGLIRLAFPDDFVSATVEPTWPAWFGGLGALILEALQPWLAGHWIDLEHRKGQIGDWPALAALGREQERVLTAFTAAAESAGRPDLVRFLLVVAAGVLPAGATPDLFCGGLQGTGPARLADRVEVWRKALAVPRQLLRLRDWERRTRTIGYLDEGYSTAQAWLSDWERLNGDVLADRAQKLIDTIEPLQVK